MKLDNRSWIVPLVAALAMGWGGGAVAAGPATAAPKKQAVDQPKAKVATPKAKSQRPAAAAKARAKTARAARSTAVAPKKSPVRAARPATPAVARAAEPQREVHWTQLPPSRFYPNGIPELRPEFLYPLPGTQVQAVAEPQRPAAGAQPEWLP